MVSVIIPAFNESQTIGRVVRELWAHWRVGEVLVVDDGSTDQTAALAAAAGAKVIRLGTNGGKAQAMEQGVRAARYQTILFADGDVFGFAPEIISQVINPVLAGACEMYVGVRARSVIFFNRLFRIFPIISGCRALTKSLWQQIPLRHKTNFKIEIALNYYAKHLPRQMDFGLICGTRHIIKERKYGWLLGFWRRLKMMADIVAISIQLYIFETGWRLLKVIPR